jgi:hypothetical protein
MSLIHTDFPPDAFFDRQWALAIVEKAMSVLQAESQARGETQRFEVLGDG